MNYLLFSILNEIEKNFSREVDNLHSTNDREPSEKSHSAANC